MLLASHQALAETTKDDALRSKSWHRRSATNAEEFKKDAFSTHNMSSCKANMFTCKRTPVVRPCSSAANSRRWMPDECVSFLWPRRFGLTESSTGWRLLRRLRTASLCTKRKPLDPSCGPLPPAYPDDVHHQLQVGGASQTSLTNTKNLANPTSQSHQPVSAKAHFSFL